MSNTIQDSMIEYIEVGGESKVRKSISPRPKDKNLVDNGMISDEHQSSQNGSLVIEQGKSPNGIHLEKNGVRIPGEDSSDDENYPAKDGVLTPSFQTVAYEEPLKLNGLDKLNTSNGDFKENGLETQSLDVSKNGASNGLGHYDETAGAKDLANGECVIKNKLQKNISNVQIETIADLFINNPSNPDLELKQDLEIRQEFINWQQAVIEQQEALLKQESVIEQVVLLKDANMQKDQSTRNLEVADLVTEGEESESVAGKGASSKPGIIYKEQLSLGLNSSEMQSKMNDINNLIERLVVSSFKPPTSTVDDEVEPDSREDGHQMESEGESKTEPEGDESTMPKRKSKQSDFEDLEGLRLLAKKPKMADQSSNKSRSCTRDEFRLAYEKCLQNYPAQSSKEFNFSEQLSKEKSILAKEHLDDIAERVLNAMSLDEYFFPKGKGADVTVKPERVHPKKELASRFHKELYDFENVYPDMPHPLVSKSCSKTIGSEGKVESSLKSSDRSATALSSSGMSLEACGTFPSTLTKLKELFKSIVLLNCFFPFVVIGYIITELLNSCNRDEKNSTVFKPLSQQKKDLDLKDKHSNRE